MAKLSPAEQAAKWAARTSAASGDYAEGVNRVTRSPGQAAAAKADKWEAGVMASRAKWRSRVGSVSLEEWKERTSGIGAQRFAGGVQASTSKMEKFVSEFQPFQDRVTEAVRGMPDTTPEQRINRAVEQMRRTAAFRKPAGGGGGGA